MAYGFDGSGSNRISFHDSELSGNASLIRSLSFWMKTSFAGAYAVGISHWTSGSRNGYSFQVRGGKAFIECYAGGLVLSAGGSVTVNDGLWHHFVILLNGNPGGRNAIYVDGVADLDTNSPGYYPLGDLQYLTFGKPYDGFWPELPMVLAEFAAWDDLPLSDREIVGLAAGFAPPRVRRSKMTFYAPMIRQYWNECAQSFVAVVGTTHEEHPRIYAGMGR